MSQEEIFARVEKARKLFPKRKLAALDLKTTGDFRYMLCELLDRKHNATMTELLDKLESIDKRDAKLLFACEWENISFDMADRLNPKVVELMEAVFIKGCQHSLGIAKAKKFDNWRADRDWFHKRFKIEIMKNAPRA